MQWLNQGIYNMYKHVVLFIFQLLLCVFGCSSACKIFVALRKMKPVYDDGDDRMRMVYYSAYGTPPQWLFIVYVVFMC